MKHAVLRASLVAALTLVPVAAFAGEPARAAAAAPLSEGTVKKIDRAANEIVLAHGPLENIGMPAMTMAFKLKDPKLAAGIKPGDKVRFQADLIGADIVVVRIEPAK